MLNSFCGGVASWAAARRLFWLTALTLTVTACSPPFNWREIRPEGQRFSVLMPARTAEMSREIDLDGLRVTMAMTGARVDASLFTVGSIELAPAVAGQRELALNAMRAGMLRNIAAPNPAERAIQIPVIDASGQRLGQAAALRVQAHGQAGGRAVTMTAVFVARGSRLWQAVAIEPGAGGEASTTMIDSFRLLE
jgi:hypothetical protein